MDIKEHEAPALEEAQEWIRKGSGLCARLQDERAELVQRIGAIDAALAALPGGTSKAPASGPAARPNGSQAVTDVVKVISAPATRKIAKMKVPDLIRHVLVQSPGIAAPTLIKELQALRPNVDAANVYSALYRMKDVRAEGARGAKTYSLNDAGEQSA